MRGEVRHDGHRYDVQASPRPSPELEWTEGEIVSFRRFKRLWINAANLFGLLYNTEAGAHSLACDVSFLSTFVFSTNRRLQQHTNNTISSRCSDLGSGSTYFEARGMRFDYSRATRSSLSPIYVSLSSVRLVRLVFVLVINPNPLSLPTLLGCYSLAPL